MLQSSTSFYFGQYRTAKERASACARACVRERVREGGAESTDSSQVIEREERERGRERE